MPSSKKHAPNHFDLAQSALEKATSKNSDSNIHDSLRRSSASVGSSVVWHETFDKVSGRKYWYNASGETSWVNPSSNSAGAVTSSTWVTSKKNAKKTTKRKKRREYVDP